MKLSYFPPLLAAYAVFLSVVLGLVFGSFGNAWAWRIVHREKISRGRSHCPKCGHTLSARDLVPLFSYLMLRGKCRYCGAPIARRYPAVEAICALFFLTALLRCGISLALVRFLLMGFFLMVAALVDCDTMELPDGLLLAAACASFLRLFEDAGTWKAMLRGALIVPAVLLLLVLLMDKLKGYETMGGGDIKLLAAVGLHFDAPEMLLLLIFACVLGLVFAAAQKRGKSVPFPFGPMLVLSAWLVLLCGAPLLSWYLSLF